MSDQLAIWYHGTNKENYKSIIQNGFAEGTHFAKHLEDAVGFGGDYVFEVMFETDPIPYWEYISDEAIPADKILNVICYSREMLFHNMDVEIKIKKLHIKADYDEGVKFCKNCNGRGQTDDYPPLTRLNERKEITVCEKCNGHGLVTLDGKHPNDHLKSNQIVRLSGGTGIPTIIVKCPALQNRIFTSCPVSKDQSDIVIKNHPRNYQMVESCPALKDGKFIDCSAAID